MTAEEKAKRYDEALEKARKMYNSKWHPFGGYNNADLENLFPELAENRDERIRKEMLNVFKQLDEGTTICGRNYDYAKWISWLEKQGEQKPNPYSGTSFEYNGHIWGMCARETLAQSDYPTYNDEYEIMRAFEAGAKWVDSHAWKPADGDDLPEIDREVIALLSNGMVVFAHRPPEYWDGKNVLTGEVTRYYPKRYDKGCWNQPDVKWWLDIDIPKTKMEEEV